MHGEALVVVGQERVLVQVDPGVLHPLHKAEQDADGQVGQADDDIGEDETLLAPLQR